MPVEAEFVNLQVSTLHDTQQFDMAGVMVRPSLNIGLDNLATPEDLNKWPHLKDLNVPRLDVNEVHLLIGQDTPDFRKPPVKESQGSRTLVSPFWAGP